MQTDQVEWICPTCKEHFPLSLTPVNRAVRESIRVDAPIEVSRQRRRGPVALAVLIAFGFVTFLALNFDEIMAITQQSFWTEADVFELPTALPQAVAARKDDTLNAIAYMKFNGETVDVTELDGRLHLYDLTLQIESRLPILETDVDYEQPLFWLDSQTVVFKQRETRAQRSQIRQVSRGTIGATRFTQWSETLGLRTTPPLLDGGLPSHRLSTWLDALENETFHAGALAAGGYLFGLSPDGKGVVYAVEESAQTSSIRLRTLADGTTRVLVSSGRNYRPIFSPDGRTIAYITEPAGLPELRVIDVRTQSVQRLTMQGSVLGFSWSPDSRKIVFSSDQDGDFDLYIVDIDDGSTAKLFESSEHELYPIWQR